MLTPAPQTCDILSFEQREGLSMRGQLCTWQKCPKCGRPFERTVIAATLAELICPTCLTRPTRYYLDIYDKKRHRISHNRDGNFLADPDTANALLSEIRNQTRFDPTQYVKKKQSTYLFQNLIKAWLADAERKVEQNEFAPGTLVIKKTFAHKYFLPYFQGEDIRRLKTHDLTEFKQGLSVSGNYLNSIIAQLRSVFSYARNEELIRNVPRITTVKVQEPSKTVLLLEEQDALIEQLGCHKPIFRFLKLTGCRPSMARALYRSDLNWKQRIIVFQHNYSGRKLTRVLKAGQILEFPMTDELYDLLSSIPANLRHRHVFINPITGKPYSHHITPILYRACDKLGWPRIAVKNFCRHSFATNLLADGTPIQFVSQLLGHRSVKTTEKSYATARIEVLRKVLDKNYVKTMSKNENDQK